MRKFKIRWLLFIVLFFLVYLVAGAVGPFVHYKKVSEETKKNFSVSECYRDRTGVDRAMLLETNKSAWMRESGCFIRQRSELYFPHLT